MTTPQETPEQSVQWSGRITAADVHGVMFNRSGLGRRGYEEGEVDVFLDHVQVEIQRLTAEKADLRDEVGRLKRQLEQSGSEHATGLNKEEAAVQAVRILTAAQQTADQYVADAEHYSRRLSSDAREHSEALIDDARARANEIISNAEHAAQSAAEDLCADSTDDGGTGRTKQELEEQVAYLRTFSQVCRTQLRSYLEALLHDIEMEWGRANPVALMSAPDMSSRSIVVQPSARDIDERDMSGEDAEGNNDQHPSLEVVLNGHTRVSAD